MCARSSKKRTLELNRVELELLVCVVVIVLLVELRVRRRRLRRRRLGRRGVRVDLDRRRRVAAVVVVAAARCRRAGVVARSSGEGAHRIEGSQRSADDDAACQRKRARKAAGSQRTEHRAATAFHKNQPRKLGRRFAQVVQSQLRSQTKRGIGLLK